MNLHEYQAKALFAEYGVPVPQFEVVNDVKEATAAFDRLGGERWAIKAQVHAGGRGKAGGVRLTGDKKEAVDFITSMLGSRLVTIQTDTRGQPVHQVLIEAPCEIDRELYLGAVIDRSLRRVVIMASTEGGVEIEKVAAETPEKILRTSIHPLVGLQPYQCRQLAFGLGLKGEQIRQFAKLLAGLVRLFTEKDLSLLEVNPLVVTKAGELLCLDAKINIDDNALYRHPDLSALHDPSQEDEREVEAKEWGLSYIALDGDIGCMVNGAGLAMATMDLIKLHGGRPANFLDVGGTATRDRVAEAFKIILSDTNVKGVLVNIFGGIVRCDLIAEGIVGAVEEVGIKVPVVVRLIGNNADRGREILNQSGLKLLAAEDLTEAAEKIVSMVGTVA
ncbi:MAG: ADP-forming succinate--CoA ligase subunit beta [Gammaproteobacteria bacterium]|nr:MAG: ADP-forming succinate--CoA ligase subunit beta [Gammaproteobacteria bacterium]